MLDNLRDQASFTEEEGSPDPNAPELPKPRKPRRSIDKITHTTAQQRFVLAVMLAFMIFLLGTMFLVISGKVVPSSIF